MIEDVIKVLKQHKNGDMQTPTAMGQIFALFGVSSRFLIMKTERGKEVFTGFDYGTNAEADKKMEELGEPSNYWIVEEEF